MDSSNIVSVLNKDPRYFVLLAIFVWNVSMLTWNIFNPMGLMLLSIMCVFPTVLFFGVFTALDNDKQIDLSTIEDYS